MALEPAKHPVDRRQLDLVVEDADAIQEAKSDNALRGIYRLLHRIDRMPELAAAVQELGHDVQTALDAFREHDKQLVNELVSLRKNLDFLISEIPEASDLADTELKPPNYASSEYWRYEQSFAYFDKISASPEDVRFTASSVSDTNDPTRSGELLKILLNKTRELSRLTAPESEPDIPPLKDIRRELGNLVRLHEHAYNEFLLASRSLPGVAYARLALRINSINPEPVRIETDEDQDRAMNEMFKLALTDAPALRAVFLPSTRRDSDSDKRIDHVAAESKHELALFVEGLRWQALGGEKEGGPVAAPLPALGGTTVNIGQVFAGSFQIGDRIDISIFQSPEFEEELTAAGVTPDELHDLQSEIQSAPGPAEQSSVVKRWLNTVIATAASSGRELAIEALSRAIARATGLPM